jgi:hypothetical protein
MSGLAEYVHAALILLNVLGLIVVLGIVWATQPSDRDTTDNDDDVT